VIIARGIGWHHRGGHSDQSTCRSASSQLTLRRSAARSLNLAGDRLKTTS
jgi:hypothetical protein